MVVWMIVAVAKMVGTMIEKCERTIGGTAFLSETTLTSRDRKDMSSVVCASSAIAGNACFLVWLRVALATMVCKMCE